MKKPGRVLFAEVDYIETAAWLTAFSLLARKERTLDNLHRCRLGVGRLAMAAAYYRAASQATGAERERLEKEGAFHFNRAGGYLRISGAGGTAFEELLHQLD